jgi:hypothetical protein
MRRHNDGSYWIPKQNASLEAEMDSTMERVGNSLRWFPRNLGFKLSDFKDSQKGEKILLVGKGPSLDKLTKSLLDRYKISLFINDSIKKADALGASAHSIQQDGNLGTQCVPKSGMHFLSWYSRGWNPKATIYKPEELGFAANSPTIIAAIKLCIYIGYTEFDLFAFDALKTNKITDYAKIIGYSSTSKRSNSERFFKQTKMVESAFKGFKWRYI